MPCTGEAVTPQSVSGGVGWGQKYLVISLHIESGSQDPTVDCRVFLSRCLDAVWAGTNSDLGILTLETLWKH